MSASYWIVARKRDVAAYLIGLKEAGHDVRAAVNSLHEGIPPDARKLQDMPETWEWLEARHWITFVTDQRRRWIYVTDIESATE